MKESSLLSLGDEISRLYRGKQGEVFLLSGNTDDVFPCSNDQGNMLLSSLRGLLMNLLGRRQIVVCYNKADGFIFADEIILPRSQQKQSSPSMRQRFEQLTQPQASAPQQTSSEFDQMIGRISASMQASAPVHEPRNTERDFAFLHRVLTEPSLKNQVAVVIEFTESFAKAEDCSSQEVVAIERWVQVGNQLGSAGNPVFLLEQNTDCVSKALKCHSNIVGIKINRPTAQEMKFFVDYALALSESSKLEAGFSVEEFVNLCSGLKASDVCKIVRLAQSESTPISPTMIWQCKAELIAQQCQGTLSVVQPKHGFEAIGALDYLVNELRIQSTKLRRGSCTCDKGWLLMGPPGTGKTIIAEALAKESGVNFVTLGNIHSKWVGESERNLALALDIIRAMAPVIVFIDEAAEIIGNGEGYNGDSGVSNRIRGMIQNAIGDESLRGKVFFILATNYPEKLPPAMLRDGRMDKRVALLPPASASERENILKALSKASGICGAQKLDFSWLAEQSKGSTGAELKEILLRAKAFAEEADDNATVKMCHLEEAWNDYISRRDEEAFSAMTANALKFINSRRLLPSAYQDYLQDEKSGQGSSNGNGHVKSVLDYIN